MMKAEWSKSPVWVTSSLADPDDIVQYMIQKKGRGTNYGRGRDSRNRNEG